MNTTVIDDIGLHHFPSVRLLDLRNRITEQVITHVTEVQRFVGVRRRILHHHEGMYHLVIYHLAIWTIETTVVIVGIDALELVNPERIRDTEVQEALYGIVFGDDVRLFGHPFSYLGSYLSRRFASQLNERKDHQGDVSLKLRTGLLQGYLAILGIDVIQRLHCRFCQFGYLLF